MIVNVIAVSPRSEGFAVSYILLSWYIGKTKLDPQLVMATMTTKVFVALDLSTRNVTHS
jgi:hypothetical protein